MLRNFKCKPGNHLEKETVYFILHISFQLTVPGDLGPYGLDAQLLVVLANAYVRVYVIHRNRYTVVLGVRE